MEEEDQEMEEENVSQRGQRRGRQPADGSWRLTEGVPGGPSDPSLLPSFGGHVAYAIWRGQERAVLECHSRADRLRSWQIEDDRVMELITGSQLSHLSMSMHQHINMPLISAFVERWQPETNSFHMSFGEMTITLHDVWYILRIPVSGRAITSDTEPDTIKIQMSLLLSVPPEQIEEEWKSGCVKFNTVRNRLSVRGVPSERLARGYLLWMLGATLFVDKTQNRLHGHFLPFLDDLWSVDEYAWGAGALAYLYRTLGTASRAYTAQISGCMTLLQAWIFEYFPEFRPSGMTGWTDDMPHACRWQTSSTPRTSTQALSAYRRRLDQMDGVAVHWTPFGRSPHLHVPITLFTGIIHCRHITEPYMSDRVLRQFGLVQIIPFEPFIPKIVYRGHNLMKYKCVHDQMMRLWSSPEDHLIRPSDKGLWTASFGNEVSPDYRQWYEPRTHLRVSPHAVQGEDAGPRPLPSDARLQYVANRLYPVHPQNRSHYDEATWWQCINEVTVHLEDLMAPRDEAGRASTSRDPSDVGVRTWRGDPTRRPRRG
ncbi:hypothetical protein Dimus_039238 [Dionaea muscipula]